MLPTCNTSRAHSNDSPPCCTTNPRSAARAVTTTNDYTLMTTKRRPFPGCCDRLTATPAASSDVGTNDKVIPVESTITPRSGNGPHFVRSVRRRFRVTVMARAVGRASRTRHLASSLTPAFVTRGVRMVMNCSRASVVPSLALFLSAVFVVGMVTAAPAVGHETDQYTLPLGREFQDLGPFV